MNRTVSVEVDGNTYVLGSDDEGSDLEAVAALVNERIAEVRGAAPGISRERSAILAALNLGDELLRERAAAKEAAGEVEAGVSEVRAALRSLAGETG